MELRLLRYFVAVAEELHFSRASARLHIAQPPLSRQIRQLEEEIGVQLLHRTKRHVALTEPGRAFLASARAILAQVDGAVLQAQRMAQGEEGQVSIGMVSSVAFGDALPRLLRAFRSSHPAVSIALQEMSAAEQADALRERRIQIGFMRTPGEAPDFQVVLFAREPLVAVLPAEHPLASRRRIPLQALARDSFIAGPRNQGLGGANMVLDACLRAGFSPDITHHALELQSVIGYVAAGFGVSLLPGTARKLAHEGVSFVSLSGPQAFAETSAVHLAGQETPALTAFLAVLRSMVKTRPR